MSDWLETSLCSILFRLPLEKTVKIGGNEAEGAINIDRIFRYFEKFNEIDNVWNGKEC